MRNQWCGAARRWALALGLAGMGLAEATQADVMTFEGPVGVYTGSTIEGNFTYSNFFGSLFRFGAGNPPPAMEGFIDTGGILRIVRNDGGLFTFDGADVAQNFFDDVVAVRFRGVLGGVLQAAADLDTTATTLDFAGGSQGSGALTGIIIDELLVELDVQSGTSNREAVDNIRLTLVPAPATLALLGLGLAGLGWSRRKR